MKCNKILFQWLTSVIGYFEINKANVLLFSHGICIVSHIYETGVSNPPVTAYCSTGCIITVNVSLIDKPAARTTNPWEHPSYYMDDKYLIQFNNECMKG